MDIIELLDKLDLNISWCYPTEKSIQIVKEHLEHPDRSMLPELKSYCLIYDTANMANMLITCLILNDDNFAKFLFNMIRPDLRDRIKNEMLPALLKDTFFLEECARIINSSDNTIIREGFSMNQTILEASSLSTLDKMILFDKGVRKENLRACKDSKLWDFRDTCIRNNLNNALYQVETEMINRVLLTVRTSPIIVHNVANDQKTTANSSQNTSKINPDTFSLSINDIQPADTSFLINHINDSDWNAWFKQNIIGNLSESKADPEDLLRVMFVYLVTLIIMKDATNARLLISLMNSKINWTDAEIKQCLTQIMQDQHLITRFENCVNFSLTNAAEHDSEIKSPLQEKIEKHDVLNPKLWNEDGTLKEEVHDKIIKIADEFIDWLKEDGIKFDLKDIRIVGSNCSYNYTDDSDLDVHLIADASTLDCPDDLYPLLYSSYRSLFNKNLDIDFYGIPVEIYVEVE